jgi:hypothetical protein
MTQMHTQMRVARVFSDNVRTLLCSRQHRHVEHFQQSRMQTLPVNALDFFHDGTRLAIPSLLFVPTSPPKLALRQRSV